MGLDIINHMHSHLHSTVCLQCTYYIGNQCEIYMIIFSSIIIIISIVNGEAHSSESVLGDSSIISIEWAVWMLFGVPHTQLYIVSNPTVVPTVSTVVTLATERLLSTEQL